MTTENYGLDFKALKVGDIIEFENRKRQHIVVRTRDELDAYAATFTITFADGTYVSYSPWIGLEVNYRPFRVVGHSKRVIFMLNEEAYLTEEERIPLKREYDKKVRQKSINRLQTELNRLLNSCTEDEYK